MLVFDDNKGIQYMQQMEDIMLRYNGRKMLYSITSASQMSSETLYEYHINGTEYHLLREQYETQSILSPIHEKLQLLSKDEIIYQQQHPIKKPFKQQWKYWLSRYLT
jgi:hypothetical protein